MGKAAYSDAASLLITAAAAVVLTLILGATIRTGAPAGPPLRELSTDTDPPNARTGAHWTVEGDSYDLAFDPVRNAVWFAVMQIDRADRLYSVSVGDGHLRHWPLPDSAHNGYLSQIEVDGTGAIWVSQEYTLTRFDPEGGAMTSVDLDLAADYAIPGALDRENPLPGTWISSLAADADGVWVARNNVTSIARYTDALEPVERFLLPIGYAGARDMLVDPAGPIWALGNQANLNLLGQFSDFAELTREFATLGGTPESRMLPIPSGIVVTGVPSTIISASGQPLGELHTDAGGTGPVVAVSNDGRFVYYSFERGRFETYDDGAIEVLLELETRVAQVRVPPPATGSATVSLPAAVSDAVVDASGRAWYFVLGEHTLWSMSD